MIDQLGHIFEGISTFGQMDAHTLLVRLGLIVVGLLSSISALRTSWTQWS